MKHFIVLSLILLVYGITFSQEGLSLFKSEMGKFKVSFNGSIEEKVYESKEDEITYKYEIKTKYVHSQIMVKVSNNDKPPSSFFYDTLLKNEEKILFDKEGVQLGGKNARLTIYNSSLSEDIEARISLFLIENGSHSYLIINNDRTLNVDSKELMTKEIQGFLSTFRFF